MSTVFDPATDTVYVTNLNDQTASVRNAAHCNATQKLGCKAVPPTVTAGDGPSWTIINLALHTIYVVDQKADHVAVLNNT